MTSSFSSSSAPIHLYIYDLARGMTVQLSPLLGFDLDGIWHTAIIAFGREWFYGGGDGIVQTRPGESGLGTPQRIILLGETRLSEQVFRAYLTHLNRDRYRGSEYHLLAHNCNHFADEVARYLVGGRGIPDYIMTLPRKVMNSPLASLIAALIIQ